ncbi:MAG: SAM-dependent methyltransferase [Lachnospiraceae bacterium]|nr:SAM-dependent methyltransferase [Lachnospiraceae bacterium]
MIRKECRYQITGTKGAQEFHDNTDAEGAVRIICEAVEQKPHFKQVELSNAASGATILISKKGHVTIKERKTGTKEAASAVKGSTGTVSAQNRAKNYIIPEGEPADFLVELQVMNKDGYVVKARYDKFRQINRYLEFVRDIADELPRKKRLRIIDFGCGKSYLTFALYWYLHEKRGLEVNITGLDLKKDVIENCAGLARRLKYDGLEFLHGDIADYKAEDDIDMVVTLHACDTATDYALYNAVCWGAKVILSVPCCQHELNKQIKSDMLQPVIRYGLIKERMSALMTDALRADMLEEQGYKVQILEFIDMEHTPKNILIRAVKKYPAMMGKKKLSDRSGSAVQDTDGYTCERFMKETGADLTLYRLLKQKRNYIKNEIQI